MVTAEGTQSSALQHIAVVDFHNPWKVGTSGSTSSSFSSNSISRSFGNRFCVLERAWSAVTQGDHGAGWVNLAVWLSGSGVILQATWQTQVDFPNF